MDFLADVALKMLNPVTWAFAGATVWLLFRRLGANDLSTILLFGTSVGAVAGVTLAQIVVFTAPPRSRYAETEFDLWGLSVTILTVFFWWLLYVWHRWPVWKAIREQRKDKE